MPQRQLHLNAFLMSSGHHEAAWRLPQSDPRADFRLDHWLGLARLAERGTFDSLFLADGPALWHEPTYRPAGALEPTILLTALAAVTERIGLIATASTTYNSPYNLARRFASLDHVSGGRAGWNIVTTADRSAAQNFGLHERPDHSNRYERATEFLDVSLKLWDSWEDDVTIADKATGRYADAARIHPIEHDGEHFRVRGPLNVPRTPPGVSAARAGRLVAGRPPLRRPLCRGDLHRTADPGGGQDFYADIKSRARRLGRDPESVKILPGIAPVIGSTEAEAQANARELEQLIVPEYGLAQLADVLEVPSSSLRLDAPLPGDLVADTAVQGAQSRRRLVIDLARRDNLTVRQLISRLGGGRGHRTIVGTPEQVADAILVDVSPARFNGNGAGALPLGKIFEKTEFHDLQSNQAKTDGEYPNEKQDAKDVDPSAWRLGSARPHSLFTPFRFASAYAEAE